jgi:dodecin
MTTKPGTIYRKTELVGTSALGYDDAIKRALERAHKTLRQLQWFEVTGERGRIIDGAIEYQVELEVGFALEDTLA